MTEPYVFLSYSRRDEAFVDRLSRDLRSAGVRLWRDTENIFPGQQWQLEIRSALNDAVVLLYVASQHSRDSGYMAQELAAVVRSAKAVIPVILDDTGANVLPESLQQFQWVDFRRPYEMAVSELLAAFPESVRADTALPEPEQASKGYVFISYADEDSDFVEKLREFLSRREHGYWDYAEADRNYHTQFVRELEGVIQDAAATLTILSESWKDSTWALREFFFSEEVGTPVFLLRAKSMGPSLAVAGTPYIDFVANAGAGYEKLGRELTRKGL